MVNSREELEEGESTGIDFCMAMGSERSSSPSSSTSRPLHNFTLPGLRWGSQKFLRCMNVNSNGQISYVGRRVSSSSHSAIFNNGNSNAPDFGYRIGKRKERENFDEPCPSPADYRRGSEFRKSGLSSKFGFPPLPPVNVNTDCGRKIRLPPESGDDVNKLPRLRSGCAEAITTASPTYEKKERAKFSVSPSRQEIEEDFVAVAGRKPPRRPRNV